jgi:hypothetical protein
MGSLEELCRTGGRPSIGWRNGVGREPNIQLSKLNNNALSRAAKMLTALTD